ncbi:hypothetical protein Dimus_034258 [Dionaea muscipula]
MTGLSSHGWFAKDHKELIRTSEVAMGDSETVHRSLDLTVQPVADDNDNSDGLPASSFEVPFDQWRCNDVGGFEDGRMAVQRLEADLSIEIPRAERLLIGPDPYGDGLEDLEVARPLALCGPGEELTFVPACSLCDDGLGTGSAGCGLQMEGLVELVLQSHVGPGPADGGEDSGFADGFL